MTESLIYSLTCYTFIITSVVCAVIRWCHVCRPYSEQREYYHPARRQVTFFLAAVVIQMPYVVRPMDADTWFFARTFGILYYPLFVDIIFNRYFYRRRMASDWTMRTYFLLVMTILLGMMFTALFFNTRDVLGLLQPWLNMLTGTVSLLLSMRYVMVSCRLVRSIDTYHEQNFSNVSDFPYLFARRVALMPLLWLIMQWIVFISDSRTVKAVGDIIFAVGTLAFLCVILHPQRQQPAADTQGAYEPMDIVGEEEEDANSATAPGPALWTDDVRREVLTIIERRYREPNLKRTEVIADVPYRKKKQAGAFITSVGFYRLVNMFRLYHLEEYCRLHPEMSSEGAAMECGFKDRFALSNARKRITEIDNMVKEVIS